MNKIITSIIIAAFACVSLSGCKKFLDVKPIDKLTGNNFYTSPQDVEAAINDLSRKLFGKITETQFIGATGEYRAGEVASDPTVRGNSSRTPESIAYIDALAKNKLIDVLDGGRPWARDNYNYNFGSITDWRTFYEVIQGASIVIEKLNEGIPGVSEEMKKHYIGEAAFARCFSYFEMVRLYGDVPYYGDAFHIEPLPRESMVTVLNNCIADLNSKKDGMLWSYGDPALKGVRATRGSAIALLMNMNMWNAGFDRERARDYYQATVNLGKELVDNEGVHPHRLLPIDQWHLVAGGRSDESLFEFFQTVNYGVSTNEKAAVAHMFLHYPYKTPFFEWERSSAYYKATYMNKIFPQDVADRRKEAWFTEIYANNGFFNFAKLGGVNVNQGGQGTANPDNSFMIFRYGESLLMYAEALAELGDDVNARTVLNRVRTRAQAHGFEGSGQALKDFIFMERSRELIGEGHHYFDLIRTRRIVSSAWTSNPLTLDQFLRGGWTWPISGNAIRNNPYITLTEYWVNGGI
ncbi:RagB/SusD family nutrient uptake outer membrane protein [Desertivirga brevis]|uniref:RagB/SusD family nutrient uptake outer membrane protein n=1 Tax=Desertivirga brevis TaxID=2810310 RepID=UPI001A96B200|nr:RagB/SusD family nutrient uptake outer membrane protein [Pedobacter sp. SYSU D00873]